MGWFGIKKTKDENSEAQEHAPDIVVPDRPEYEDDGIPINLENEPSDDPAKASCCKRLASELNPCQPWFLVNDKVTGRTLDIPESFAPASCYAFLWKLFATAGAILTLTWGLVRSDHPNFYFAYLTTWGVSFVVIYMVFSIFNTVFAARTPQPEVSVGWRIRATWFMGTLGTHMTVITCLLYWLLIYDPEKHDIHPVTVLDHGGVLVLIGIDTMFVNRIPFRWQHYYGIIVVDLCFVIWSLIHAYGTDIGNPNNSDNDPETNDDAIYQGVLEWEDDWVKALTYCIVITFVVGPLVMLLLWCLSNGICNDRRRYVDSVDERDQRPTVNDVEEGSIFAKWR